MSLVSKNVTPFFGNQRCFPNELPLFPLGVSTNPKFPPTIAKEHRHSHPEQAPTTLAHVAQAAEATAETPAQTRTKGTVAARNEKRAALLVVLEQLRG
jgi:hypothetical protein